MGATLWQEISQRCVVEKLKGRVKVRVFFSTSLMGVPHYILTCHWVNAFIQSALQVA